MSIKSDIKIKGIDCSWFSDTKVFKLENLLFATEIFLNAPSEKQVFVTLIASSLDLIYYSW